MAEFKLGRIKFVWKGDWSAGQTYYVDDVIRYGGRTYICRIGHTSSVNFYTDEGVIPSKWNQMSDGTEYRSDWTPNTFYKENDLVKYGALVYLCNTSHTSSASAATGLEANQSNWTLYAEGFDWKSNWAISTRYKKNDLVRYGGYIYVANTGHTSAATIAAGLEANAGFWDEFNRGIEYKGDWASAVRYKINDVVKYGAGLWICTTAYTSTGVFSADQSNWSQFLEGFEFEEDWNTLTVYQPGDVVRYGGNLYIARTNHVGANPSTNGSAWSLFTEGFNWVAEWNIGTGYRIGEVVSVSGSTYLAVADSPAVPFTVTASNAGTNLFTGPTAGLVAGMAIRFTGTTFGNVFTGATYYVKLVAGATTFTISTTPGGTTFVPATATGSMSATAAPHPTNTSYWARLTSGISWQGEWTDDREYDQGDAVRYGNNAYICLLKHRSEGDDGSTVRAAGGGAVNSRPDQDSAGIYWNILSVGSETSVLTTQGDLVYYGGAGPTRLPIGLEGQVLRAGAEDPEWVTLGDTDFKYYVGPHGTDGPAPIFGKTPDKPFKTIRYACEQIEEGPRNPAAKYLLELNRAFIQKEVTEFIQYQVTNNISPFTSSFDYDEYKCERDVGFTVDALIYDLCHGGNIKTRGVANSLIGGLTPEETESYPGLAIESDESVAAYNYMLSVIENVLDQTAPAINYQNLNGDNSTAKVLQDFYPDIEAEAGSFETVQSLVTIVTDAITVRAAATTPAQIAAAIASVPARFSPSNLINVATGQYREVLPIIVPEQTCVQGDELRSTNAGPAGSLISKDDARYSIGALGRLETVVGQIILGTDVTESAGNTQVQSAAFPFASAPEVTDIQRLVRTIQHQIDFKIGTTVLQTVTNPTGYNVGFLAGFGSARALLRENKDFLKDEITAFIAANYPAVKYSKTKCRRDIGFIVDAVCYDLTYGGKQQTLTAGLAYFDGDGSTDLQIDSSEVAATAAAYSRLKTVMQQVIANTSVTRTAGNAATQWTDSTNLTNGSNANAAVGALIDVIINIIQGDSTQSLTPQINITQIATLNTFTSNNHGLEVGDAVIPRRTANGLTAGVKYWVVGTVNTNTFQLAATYGGSLLSSFTNGTGLDLDFEIIDYPTATDGVTSTTALITAAQTLDAAQETIVTNATAFITANYPTLVYNTAKCQRDVRLILEAVMFDFMFNSNVQTRTAAYSYLRASASDVFDLGQKTATRAAFAYVRTQANSNVGGNATAQARIATLMTLLDDIVYSATNEGSRCQTEIRAADYARLQLERNRAYIVSEITAYSAATYRTTATAATAATDVFTCTDTSWMQRNAAIRFSGTVFGGISTGTTYYVQNVVSSTTFKISTTRNSNTAFNIASDASGSMTVALFYDTLSCERDVNRYIDALKYDLHYPGNYKSRFAARYYANAVNGSLEEDMYYLRDTTGLRDQTLQGLTGDLLAPNQYGTSRVSAGAYASLDPGWGPDDYRTWIINRSPYVQGLTCIGTAAVGQKIDGALHNGGNDSITSNDFTQVISDGIGAWITNNGRAELVSVFTYYAHIGYLAENGGRIRGTNGNCSYGDFGAVAEGVDDRETPNTAVVDNRFQFEVSVPEVYTNGSNLLAFEFENAGIDYTELTWTVTGGGINASVEQDDFRDNAVYEVRLTGELDDSPQQFGGLGYITNSNTAQGGTATQITIAATDGETSTAYPGMKIYLDGGAGVGQFGIIATYNSGSKIATVTRERDGVAGWDHVVPGTAIVSPDASTTYIIEPRLSFTSPTYASEVGTGMPSAGNYAAIGYAPAVQTYLAVASTGGSGSGATFNIIKKGTKYTVKVAAGGTGYTRLNTLTIAGTSLGGASPANNITIIVTSINTVTGAVIAFDFTGLGQGGNYVALLQGSATAVTSTGGAWSTRTLPSSINWDALASGQDLTVIPSGSMVAGTAYKILTPGDSIFTGVGAENSFANTTFIASGPAFGTGTVVSVNSVTVAIATGSNITARSVNGGVSWTLGGNLPSSTTWVSIAYGQGRWIAIASGGTATAISTDGGQTWVSGGALPASATWTAIAYGAGKFVAVASGGTQAASSTDNGVTWLTRALPSSTNWSSVAFGNNRFIAVSSTSGTAAAYSLDGLTWAATTIISGAYLSIAYGQGEFFAVGATTTAASSPEGLVWTSRTISTSNSSSVAFGNINSNGRFVTISNSGATNVSIITDGATARARAAVAENKIFQIRMIDPGSSYSAPPTMTITDPNNTFEAPFTVRIGSGVVANPSFINRGSQFTTGSAEENTGDGYADNYQAGGIVAVRRITQRPVAGSNVEFSNLPGRTFKLVNVLTFLGQNDGSYTAFFQISPTLTEAEAPEHLDDVTTRIRYSQVRLTGHDFLDIGTGSFTETNYPGIPTQPPLPANETKESEGGRVFYTSTDQDGNFRVGELFAIEQSTGVATLNADAFNISGLQELNLGNVTLGGGSATITEFSTDPFFTQDSDNVIPTQRAIKAYIAGQIGGGGASLNVNSVTAGAIKIDSNQITNTTGSFIKMDATFDFRAGVIGVPLAMNYFLVV